MNILYGTLGAMKQFSMLKVSSYLISILEFIVGESSHIKTEQCDVIFIL